MKSQTAQVYDSSARRIPLVYDLGELIRYRFLVSNLVARDLKIRYKRSVLGFIWAMLNPLLTMAVLVVVFSQLFKFNTPHYAVSLLGGTLLWTLYAQGSNAAMGSLQSSGSIIRKMYVPPVVFVTSAVGSALVNFGFALVPFVLLAMADHLTPSFTWIFALYPALLTAIFTMGIGLIVGALIVFFTDIFEIYQVVLQGYYFLTPIFYPIKIVPKQLQVFEQYNPMYLSIHSFQQIIISGAFPPDAHLLRDAGMSLAVLAIGWFFFSRVEGKFVYHF